MDEGLSAGIDRLRAISIAGVVCIHATSPLINSRAGDPIHDRLFWSLVALNQAARFSVPAFFFLAGLLAAGPGRPRTEGTAGGPGSIGARLRRLLLPYATWSLILWGAPELLRGSARPGEMAARLLLGQTFAGGYFLIALAQLAIVTPWILRRASSRPREAGLAAAALLSAVVGAEMFAACGGGDSGPAALLRDAFSACLSSGVVWAPFFVAGAIAGLHPGRLQGWLVRRAGWLVVLAAVAWPLTLVEFRITLDATASPGLAATFLKPSCVALAVAVSGLALVVPAGRVASSWIARLAPASFAIYLAHGGVIQALWRLMPDPGDSLAAGWAEVSVAVAAGVALPLAWHGFAGRRLPASINVLLFGRPGAGPAAGTSPGAGRSGGLSRPAPSGAAPSWSGTSS